MNKGFIIFLAKFSKQQFSKQTINFKLKNKRI